MISVLTTALAMLAMADQPAAAPSAQPTPAAADERTARPLPVAGARDRAAEQRAVALINDVRGDALETRLMALSERGNLIARWQLAVLLDTGARDIARDPDRALALATSAAQAGEALAFTSLGVMYATGVGRPANYAAAMRAYRAAARMGEPHGFYGVGVLHHLGQGVERDNRTAAAWLLAAGVLNDRTAQTALNRIMPELGDVGRRAAVEQANAILADHGHTQRVRIGGN